MPATMNVSLPEPLKAFVDEQVRLGGFSGTSDYVRQLIREHREKVAAAALRTLIAEGVTSGAPRPVDAEYWANKRNKHRL